MAGFPPAMMVYNIISRVSRFFKGGSAFCPKKLPLFHFFPKCDKIDSKSRM